MSSFSRLLPCLGGMAHLSYRLRRPAPPAGEQGFSVMMILVAVGIFGILAAVLVARFDTSGSKGQATYNILNSIGHAANRFKMDTGCYPQSSLSLLYEQKADGDANSCHIKISGQGTWNGPYIQASKNSKDAIYNSQVNESMTFMVGQSLDHPAVTVRHVPPAIALVSMRACGATGSPESDHFGDTTKCMLNTDINDSALRTITYFYADGGPDSPSDRPISQIPPAASQPSS